MYPTILLSGMDKIVGQTDMTIGLEEKLRIKTCKTLLKKNKKGPHVISCS